ncbi:uncharacterized protein LOC141659906 [Apium graveolens]|uniref:uncharacterized protein LOC141659906 n=1 Tax=Apium graveolens TaxID=4045 RepID=UPI003D7B47D0
MRMFIWRFCKNNIPVSTLRWSKGVQIPLNCPMCSRDIENVLHLFFECDYARSCWQRTELVFDMRGVEYAADWLLEKLDSESDDRVINITKVLSWIWFARNKKVWEEKLIGSSMSVDMSSRQINSWQVANRNAKRVKPQLGQVVSSVINWKPPDRGWLKLNVDASVKKGDSNFAIGMVIRNEDGNFIMGKNLRIAGCVNVLEVEAYGVWVAIKWIEELQLKNVTVESDSSLVVQALQQGSEYLV